MGPWNRRLLGAVPGEGAGLGQACWVETIYDVEAGSLVLLHQLPYKYLFGYTSWWFCRNGLVLNPYTDFVVPNLSGSGPIDPPGPPQSHRTSAGTTGGPESMTL